MDITGFTALTDAAVKSGAAGTERLARSLNAFFTRIIEIVADHGGDVAKIVGDALLPMWPAVTEDLDHGHAAGGALRACHCSRAGRA